MSSAPARRYGPVVGTRLFAYPFDVLGDGPGYGTVGQLVFLVSSMQNRFGGNCFSSIVNLVIPPDSARQSDSMQSCSEDHGSICTSASMSWSQSYMSIEVNSQVAEIYQVRILICEMSVWLCHVVERMSGLCSMGYDTRTRTSEGGSTSTRASACI